MAAADMPYSQRKKVRKATSSDTTAVASDSIKDSIATIMRDSLGREIVDTTKMDSLQLAIYHHNRAIDDSIRLDSINRQRANGINSPVQYEASDSLVYNAKSKTALLYGQSKVKYENMDLEAEKIHMSLDSSLVHATGTRDTTDSTGHTLVGTPVFSMGQDKYESDTMAFNFKTKKGLISKVYTQQEDGFLQSEISKRSANGDVYLQHGRYTTCDKKHPDFYIALSRGKVRPGKDVTFGPAYLVVADVPLPLAIPYGFFPFTKSYSSGFIMPTYGDESDRGFYLRDGGYYFAINDKWDLKLLGEIYTKGSWGLSAASNYNKRYRYSGSFFLSYQNTKTGDKNMPDYSEQKSFKVQWSHRQDAKANPYSSLSASVNFATSSYERNNLNSLYNPQTLSQSTRTSSVSWSTTFSSIGLSLSSTANLSQNMRDSTLSVTLPDLNISLSRFYPFKRKHAAGDERWYEKISMSYTGQISNRIDTKEDRFLKSNLIKDWRNGMQHRVPIDATFQLFKYINISPSFSFRDIMYASRINRSWNTLLQQEVCDTTYGFYNLYDWNVGVTANTTLYGFYKPWKKLFGGKIVAIRHVFKPAITFSYAPDFTASRYGYRKEYERTDASGNSTMVAYSPYSNGIYGYPSGSKQGLISMSVSNNLEMKVRSDRDSTGYRKISLIDELSASLSYNMAASRQPWSNLSTRLRLKLGKNKTFSMAAVFATYAYKFNENGQVVTSDRTEWSYGRFGRFQGMSQNLSYTLNNQTWNKLMDFLHGRRKADSSAKDNNTADADADDVEDANVDPDLKTARKGGRKPKNKAKVDADGYLTFSMPWSLTLSYGITMAEDRSRQINVRRMRYPFSFTQTLNASGYLRIAEGWNISFSSGYDFEMHKLSMTTMSLSRDLHCFEMSANVVLKPYSSFNFTFRARASELADALKWEKRSSYSTNVEWY